MYSTIQTAQVDGIHTYPVCVEVDVSTGMPMFDMVGNLSSEVKEAKERVRTALHNYEIVLPAKRITVNLSPGNRRKSGTGFDLAIAVALLISMGMVSESVGENFLFVGELSLSGKLLPVNGILPMVSDGMERGITSYIVPLGNLLEAKLVTDARCYGFDNLWEVISFLQGEEYEEKVFNIEGITPVKERLDFCDINGQEYVKRACEVAAAGLHNMLLVGPPGAGKTMISERMSTILPPLSKEEQLELSKIYSVCGMLKNKESLLSERPFRSPHHTVTPQALCGGGRNPMPGEISLAHCGVLFLDELPEFQKKTLEILRQPMEDKVIHISRVDAQVEYPANFLLLAAMNPCNCGYFPDMQKCRCTQQARRRYLDRISQPLVDRIDICVETPAVSYKELTQKGNNEHSSEIRKRVLACHEIQKERFSKEGFHHNSQIPAARLEEFCLLGKKEKQYLEQMYEKLNLTGRTYHKILRVARTIGDLKEEKEVTMGALMEAVCYRSCNDKYWGGSGI